MSGTCHMPEQAWPSFLACPELANVIPGQIILSAACFVATVLSFHRGPSGVPMPEGMRMGLRGGLLVFGCCLFGFFFVWHFITVFLRKDKAAKIFYRSYGRYKFYEIVEFLVAIGSFGIGLVSLVSSLTNSQLPPAPDLSTSSSMSSTLTNRS